MSYRCDSRRRTRRSRKRSDDVREALSSNSTAAGGERAWDYLLRRKTENINDRIYKRKGSEDKEEKTDDFSLCLRKIKKEKIESDEDLPLHMRHQKETTSDLQNYSSSREFWNYTAGEWLNKEMPVRVKSEFEEDYNTMTAMSRNCERETTTLRDNRQESQRTSDLNYTAYDRNFHCNDTSRDFVANVSNYIEGVRRSTKHKRSTSTVTYDGMKHNTETHQPTNDSYGRNVNDPTDTEIAYPVQNYCSRYSPDRRPYDDSFENYQSSSQALYPDHVLSNYDMKQSHRRCMANEKLSHKRPNYDDDNEDNYLGTKWSVQRSISEDMPFHNRPDDDEDAHPASMQGYRTHISEKRFNHNDGNDRSYHAVSQAHGRHTPNEAFYHQLRNDEASYNAPRQSNNHYEQLNYHETNGYEGDYQNERQCNERHIPEEILSHNPPNDKVDDLRHLINIKSRGKPLAEPDIPFDLPLMQKSKDSANDAKQSCKKDSRVTTGQHTLVCSLPYPAEGVEVVYTADSVEADAWFRNNVIDCDDEAVGFDIEWKPQFVSKKKGGMENKTAVLQLAVGTSCLVLHLHHMKTLPKYLTSVLSDKKIKKVGNAILQDVKKLKRDTRIECIGLIDTQMMAKSVGVPASSKFGLKALASRFLGVCLDKKKSVTMSNWEKFPLTIQQINYAALDAWIGLKIYEQMKSMEDTGTTLAKSVEVPVIHCPVCNKKIKSKDGLKQHLKSVHPSGDQSTNVMPANTTFCHICNKEFKDNNALDQHLKIAHPNSGTAQTTKSASKTVCHVCGKKLKDNYALDQHLCEAHVQCMCGMFFPAKVSKHHKRHCQVVRADKKTCSNVSSSAPVEKEEPGSHVCQGCGKKCKTTEELVNHIKKVGHVSCPFCSRLLHSVASQLHIRKCKGFLGGQWECLSTGQVNSTANVSDSGNDF